MFGKELKRMVMLPDGMLSVVECWSIANIQAGCGDVTDLEKSVAAELGVQADFDAKSGCYDRQADAEAVAKRMMERDGRLLLGVVYSAAPRIINMVPRSFESLQAACGL